MKNKIIISLLVMSVSVFSHASSAGALKKDCSPAKAGKNAAMKATVGVGGRCSPADAAKNSAKDVVGVEGEEALKDQGERKGKNKDKDKDKDEKNPLNKDRGIKNTTLKKVIN